MKVVAILMLVAMAASAPVESDVLNKLLNLLGEEKENKMILRGTQTATSDTVTFGLQRDIGWDSRGSWVMSVDYFNDIDPKKAKWEPIVTKKSWSELGRQTCPIPGTTYTRSHCITKSGLESGHTYTFRTTVYSGSGDVIKEMTLDISTRPSAKNTKTMNILKKLIDLLREEN